MEGPTSSHDIAAAVLGLYTQLPKNGKPAYPKYTVLSGIVAECNGACNVLSLATGTKCAGENILSSRGAILVDSHAEILARRGLIRYFYMWLVRCSKSPDDASLAECPLMLSRETKKFRLKPTWKLHLYTSDSPCGDAAVYSRSDGLSFSGKKARPCPAAGASKVSDELPGAVRLKPGRHDIPDHCRTKSMSCSDKIARWNYMGLQGSLLSLILEPVYLSGIVVSRDPFELSGQQLGALQRSLVDRLPPYDFVGRQGTASEEPKDGIALKAASILSYNLLSISQTDMQFPVGKCSSEERYYDTQACKSQIDVAGPRPAPFDLSINWIAVVPDGTSSTCSRSHSASLHIVGTVEITQSRCGIPQGSSLKNSVTNKSSAPQENNTVAVSAMSRLSSRKLFQLFQEVLSSLNDDCASALLCSLDQNDYSLETNLKPGEVLGEKKEVTAVDKLQSLLLEKSYAWWKQVNSSYTKKKNFFHSYGPFQHWIKDK